MGGGTKGGMLFVSFIRPEIGKVMFYSGQSLTLRAVYNEGGISPGVTLYTSGRFLCTATVCHWTSLLCPTIYTTGKTTTDKETKDWKTEGHPSPPPPPSILFSCCCCLLLVSLLLYNLASAQTNHWVIFYTEVHLYFHHYISMILSVRNNKNQ